MNSFQEVAISKWSWTILTMCTLTLFISMNCLDMIQLPTKMTNANRTLQTFVDMPIVNGVNCSLKLHWLQVFQKVQHWFCFLKSKVSVSSIFLHYIPLDQLIPIIRVECQNEFPLSWSQFGTMKCAKNALTDWLISKTSIFMQAWIISKRLRFQYGHE